MKLITREIVKVASISELKQWSGELKLENKNKTKAELQQILIHFLEKRNNIILTPKEIVQWLDLIFDTENLIILRKIGKEISLDELNQYNKLSEKTIKILTEIKTEYDVNLKLRMEKAVKKSKNLKKKQNEKVETKAIVLDGLPDDVALWIKDILKNSLLFKQKVNKVVNLKEEIKDVDESQIKRLRNLMGKYEKFLREKEEILLQNSKFKEIIENDDRPNVKIRELYELGLDSRMQQKLDFTHFTHVCSFFRKLK